MNRQYYRRRKRRIAEMNVVPYIDVMLVLLIIFMITSPLLTEGVKVELPKTRVKTEAFSSEGNIIVVTINADGEIFLQNEDYPVSEAMLVDRVTALVEKGKKTEVFVKGDRNAFYGRVTEVMALLKAAKIARVSLVTERH
jgi:biopolymer transport protein TolR